MATPSNQKIPMECQIKINHKTECKNSGRDEFGAYEKYKPVLVHSTQYL